MLATDAQPRRRPLLAALSFRQARPVQPPQTERHTGLVFPGEFCSRGEEGCAQLEGVGLRAKRVAGLASVNVYALGVYVDEAALVKLLAGKHTSATPALFAAVAGADVEKSLRLVFARSVDGSAVSDALAERLQPLLGAGSPALAAFRAAFAGAKLTKGSVVTLAAARGGALRVVVAGRAAPPIAAPALCRAVFDIYLGSEPPAPEAKKALGAKLVAALAAGRR